MTKIDVEPLKALVTEWRERSRKAAAISRNADAESIQRFQSGKDVAYLMASKELLRVLEIGPQEE